MNEPIRNAAAALLFSAALAGPAGASDGAPTTTEYRFGVFYGDKRIGDHIYEVTTDGDADRVESRADFRVKLLFVTAYRYQHQANELWRDGCLAGLSSVTNDNGERFRVEAARQEAGLILTSLQPESDQVTLTSECPASFAYWDRPRLEREALINAQNGAIGAARLIEKGTEQLEDTVAVRYQLEAEGLSPIRLWYRQSDDVWIRLETDRQDGTLQYRLESLERRPASGIEEDARVEDPPGI